MRWTEQDSLTFEQLMKKIHVVLSSVSKSQQAVSHPTSSNEEIAVAECKTSIAEAWVL